MAPINLLGDTKAEDVLNNDAAAEMAAQSERDKREAEEYAADQARKELQKKNAANDNQPSLQEEAESGLKGLFGK